MWVLVLLALLFVGGLIVAGAMGFGLFALGGHMRKRAEQRAPEILDKAFVGDDVVFKINMQSPSYETVVLGAKARGYGLTAENNDVPDGSAKTLIFTRHTV